MSQYLPYTVTALARTTEPDGKNVVTGAIVRVFQDFVQQMIYEDADGLNPSMEKQTDINGLRTIFLPSGEYELDVNGRRTGFVVGDEYARGLTPALQSALAASDSTVLVGGVEAGRLANNTMEWDDSAHKLLQTLSTGTIGSPIFPNAISAPQGLAYYDGKYYMLQSDGGGNYTSDEVKRIVEYDATDIGTSVSNNFFTNQLQVGHQGLCAFYEGSIKFVTGLTTLTGYSGATNSNKGYSVINWMGAATDQTNVTGYQLFGATDSDHPFRTFYGAMPTITPDGRKIAIIAQSTEESVGYYLFVYDRHEVESSLNPLNVMPKVFVLLPPITADRGYFSQGVATDGEFVYTFNGHVNPLTQHTVRKIDFSGRLINEMRVDTIRGHYGYDNLYDGHPEYGCPRSFEPEGLVYRDGELLLLCVDNWRAYGDIVNFDGRQFAFIGTQPVNQPPSFTGSYSHWVRTNRAATAGDWDSSTSYARGAATRYSNVVVGLREATGSSDEYPVSSGIPVRESIAQLPIGNSATDISIPYGEALQISAYSESGETYKNLIQYTSNSRQLRLYDGRPESDNSKFTSVYSNFDGDNERIEYRARTSNTNGAGFNLYGAYDNGVFAHGYLLSTKNGTTMFAVDTVGFVKPIISGPFITPINVPLTLGAAVPHNQTVGTSINAGYGAIVYNNAATSSGGYSYGKARGTEDTPLAVQSGDRLGEMWFNGYTGTQFLRGAGILGIARGTINSGSMGAALQFRTQASGSGALTIQWEMQESGDLESMRSDNAIILRSPDNTRWRVTVDNTGELVTTAL